MQITKASSGDVGFEIIPRPGTTHLSKTADLGTISTGMRLGTLGAGLVLFTGVACYRNATDQWHRVAATAPTVGVDTKSLTMGAATVTSCDAVSVGGYQVSAYAVQDPTAGTQEIRYSVLDANGVPVVSNVRIGLVSDPTQAFRRVRIVTTSTRALITYALGVIGSGNVQIFGSVVDTATPAASPLGGLITSGASEVVYDVQTVGSSGTAAVIYRNSGTNALNQRLVTVSTMTVTGATAYAGLTGILNLAYLTNTFSSNVLYVAHVDGANGLRVSTFDGTTLALTGTTVYDAAVTSAYNVAGHRAGAAVSVFFTALASNPWDRQIKVSTGGAANTVIRSLNIASRVVQTGGNFYVLARYTGSFPDNVYFLFDLTNGVEVGKALAGLALDSPLSNFADQFANLTATGAGNVLLTSSLRFVAVESGGGTFASNVGAATMAWTLQDTTVGKPVELNGVLHIPGAQPYLYDGATLTEHGFPINPAPPIGTPAAGGSMTPSVTYTYKYVYEWIDAVGGLWQSAPLTAPLSVPLSAGQTQVTLTIPTLRVTRKTSVSIVVYRTLANGDGSIYYQVSSATAPLMSTTTADTVSFVDQVADTSAVAGRPLYSPNNNPGSVLENIAPPGCRTMATHRGRLLIGAVEGDPDAVWFSKDVQTGFGVHFSDFLVSRITSVEPITAVGTRETYAIACTKTTAWNSINEYPDDTGAGGVLVFQQQSDTTGCATIGMMAGNDQGMMTYAGTKGVWRMSRGMSWDYVGAALEDDIASVTPKAIVAVPGLNQMRIVASLGGNSTVLVYEALWGQWAKWTYGQAPTTFVDGVLWNGAMAYLCSDGTVIVEAATSYIDNGVPASVPHVVTFSDMNLYGVAGFGRLYITQLTGRVLGSGAGFVLTAAQAFDGVAIANKSITYAGNEGVLNFEVDPGTMGKSSKYVLTISDSAVADDSAWTLAAVTALIGTKKGLNKLPAARRAT